jgi:uncharacterized protein (TIGR00290 family)
MKDKILISWSGGKESALALYDVKKQRNLEIVALLTTVNEDYARISMHGIREILLGQQAQSLNIPLEKVYIPKNSSGKEYESRLKTVLVKYKNTGVSSTVFGDIFLEDLRRWREDNLAKIGMRGMFPLWKRDTRKLAQRFIESGFKSIITCVDSKVLDKKFVGRNFNQQFLNELPEGIDPCGENGEFHSFVYAGPIFNQEIKHTLGEVVLRDKRFYYCDIIPERAAPIKTCP